MGASSLLIIIATLAGLLTLWRDDILADKTVVKQNESGEEKAERLIKELKKEKAKRIKFISSCFIILTLVFTLYQIHSTNISSEKASLEKVLQHSKDSTRYVTDSIKHVNEIREDSTARVLIDSIHKLQLHADSVQHHADSIQLLAGMSIDSIKLKSASIITNLTAVDEALKTSMTKIDKSAETAQKSFTQLFNESNRIINLLDNTTKDLIRATELANYPLSPVKFDITFAISLSRPDFSKYLSALKKLALGKNLEDLKPTQFLDNGLLNKYPTFLNNFYFIPTSTDTIGFTASFDKNTLSLDSNTIFYYDFGREVNYHIRKFGGRYYLVQEYKIIATIPHIFGNKIFNAKDLKGYTFFFLRHYPNYIPIDDMPIYWKPITIEFDKQLPYTIQFEPEFNLKQTSLNSTNFYMTSEKWNDYNVNGRRAVNLEDPDFKNRAKFP